MYPEAGVSGPLPPDLVRPPWKSLALGVFVPSPLSHLWEQQAASLHSGCANPAPGVVCMLALLSHLLHHSTGTPRVAKMCAVLYRVTCQRGSRRRLWHGLQHRMTGFAQGSLLKGRVTTQSPQSVHTGARYPSPPRQVSQWL